MSERQLEARMNDDLGDFFLNYLSANVGEKSLFLSVQHEIRIILWKSGLKNLLMWAFFYYSAF